jgi:hypothetical protein
MKPICLQFESIIALKDFLAVIRNINCEVNYHRLTIICELTEEELQLAIRSFGAKQIADKA